MGGIQRTGGRQVSTPPRSTRPKPFLYANPERKLMTKKYCAKHHIHYFEVCPLCDPIQKNLIDRVWRDFADD